MLTIGWDAVARVWEPGSGKELYYFNLPDCHQYEWFLTPDHRVAVTWAKDRPVRVWETVSGKVVREIVSKDQLLGPACLTADGKTLIARVVDKNPKKVFIRSWDVATGNQLPDIVPPPMKGEDQEHIHHELYPAAGGKLLVAVQERPEGGLSHASVKAYRFWDYATGKELPAPEAFASLGPEFALAPNGQIAAHLTLNEDQSWQWRLIDLATGERLRDLEVDKGKSVFRFLTFSPNSRVLLAVEGDQGCRLWDATTGKQLPAPPGFNRDNAVRYAAFSPDSRSVAIGNRDGVLGLYEVATGKLLRRLEGLYSSRSRFHEEITFPDIAFSPDGKVVAAAGGEGMVRVWNVVDGKELCPVRAGHEAGVAAVAVSADGKLIASAAEDGTVRLWDAATGRERRVLPMEFERWHWRGNRLPGVTLSPAGETLAAGTPEGTIYLWETATGKLRLKFTTPEECLTSLMFTPDGKELLTGGKGMVRSWDATTGQQLRHFPAPDLGPGKNRDEMLTMGVSPDGRLLAVAERWPKGVHLWELSTGTLRKRMPGPDRQELALGVRPVWADNRGYDRYQDLPLVTFAPDSKTVAWHWKDTIHLLDVTGGKELRRFGGLADNVTGIAISPTGTFLAASDDAGTIRFWDIAAGTVLGELKAPRGGFECLAFSPDGQTLITGGTDTTILLWDMPRILEQWKTAPPELTPDELNIHWKRLTSLKGTESAEAMDRLQMMPPQAIALFRQNLRPVPAVDRQRVAVLIADLENDRFEVRERATQELEKLAELAEPFLRKRLAEDLSLEARQRVEQVLEKRTGFVTAPDQVQTRRAVEVLERLATPEARDFLRELSTGAPEAWLTKDALASLKRLSRDKGIGR